MDTVLVIGSAPGGSKAVKQFSCGDVVAGCAARFVCSTEDDVLAEVAAHARVVHGVVDIPAELVEQVRANLVTVA